MSNQVTSQANLLAYIDSMKEEHDQYISELAKHSNEVSAWAGFIEPTDIVSNFFYLMY